MGTNFPGRSLGDPQRRLKLHPLDCLSASKAPATGTVPSWDSIKTAGQPEDTTIVPRRSNMDAGRGCGGGRARKPRAAPCNSSSIRRTERPSSQRGSRGQCGHPHACCAPWAQLGPSSVRWHGLPAVRRCGAWRQGTPRGRQSRDE